MPAPRPAEFRRRAVELARQGDVPIAQLANAVFAFIEGFYNPRRRHSTLGYLSPADYENAYRTGRHTDSAA